MPKETTNLESKEGQVPPRRNEGQAPFTGARYVRTLVRSNSTKTFNKLPNAKYGIAIEAKTSGDCRLEGNLQQFQALLLVRSLCIEKTGWVS